MGFAARKANRLKGYDYSNRGAYFVTVCSAGKEQVFGSISPCVKSIPANVGDVGDGAHTVPHCSPGHIKLSLCGQIAKAHLERIAGIDKYVIMPNHIHMIILIECGRAPEDWTMWASSPTETNTNGVQSISQRIASFKTLVTKEYGHSVWQRSFYDHVIRDYDDYIRIWEYIDTNPAKWEQDRFYIE